MIESKELSPVETRFAEIVMVLTTIAQRAPSFEACGLRLIRANILEAIKELGLNHDGIIEHGVCRIVEIQADAEKVAENLSPILEQVTKHIKEQADKIKEQAEKTAEQAKSN